MRSQVEKYHFVVHYAYHNKSGGLMDVESNLCVFDTKTLCIVQTIAERRMFGHVGKGNFSLVPVKTGSGESPLNHIRIPLFVRTGKGVKWSRATYLGVMLGLERRLELDAFSYGSRDIDSEIITLRRAGVPVEWLTYPGPLSDLGGDPVKYPEE